MVIDVHVLQLYLYVTTWRLDIDVCVRASVTRLWYYLCWIHLRCNMHDNIWLVIMFLCIRKHSCYIPIIDCVYELLNIPGKEISGKITPKNISGVQLCTPLKHHQWRTSTVRH
jgi:hypothetical protein